MSANKNERFIFFIRHGETDSNKRQEWQGKMDIPLNYDGKKQAALCGVALKKIVTDSELILKRIFSSPQKRAMETANRITREFNLPLVKKEALREIDHGICEGLTRFEVQKKYPEVWIKYKTDKANLQFPKGESVLEVHERVKKEIENILISLEDIENECVLIVAHGGSISLSIIALLKWPVVAMNGLSKIANTAISIVKICEQKRSLVVYNWLPHLEQTNGGNMNIRKSF